MSTYEIERNSQGASPFAGASQSSTPPTARRAKSTPNFTRRAAWLALAYALVTGGFLAGLLMQLRDEAMATSKRPRRVARFTHPCLAGGPPLFSLLDCVSEAAAKDAAKRGRRPPER